MKFLKILFSLFSITFLISCSSEYKSKITFMVGGAPNEVAFWDKIVKEFEEQTGIEVEILKQPADTDQRRQSLVIALASKAEDPDVFLMDVIWIAQFSRSNWLEPLNKYLKMSSLSLDIFFKNVVSEVDTYKGKIVALPVYIDGGILYYRKDLLKKFGIQQPPQTWDELINYSLKVQNFMRKEIPNFYGFVWQGAQYEGLICNFLEIASSNNGGVVFNNHKIILDSPQNIKALELLRAFIHHYKISPPNTFTEMKEEEVRIYFQKGYALFERNWPYAWILHQKDDSPVKNKIGIAPLPHFKNGKIASTLGGWHIGISKYSDHKEESWKFVEFILSYNIQKKLALNLGWNPGRKDVYEDKELLKTLPHFKKLKHIFNNLISRPNLPYYPLISETMQRYINASLANKLTPQEALKLAEKEINFMIKRYEE